MGLYDAVLIKENHILSAGSLENAVAQARAAHPDLTLEIEVESIDELHEIISSLPLFPWMDVTITPLSAHALDPESH